MRKLLVCSLLLCCVIFIVSGCRFGGTGDKYEGMRVTNAKGQVFILKHRLVDLYFIRPIVKQEVLRVTPRSDI